MAKRSFRYRALDQQGADVAGDVAALDERSAFEALTARGLTPYEMKPARQIASPGGGRARRITRKDLVRYLRQLATLISANVNVLETLTTLGQSSAHAALAGRTQAIRRDLRAGRKLSDALAEHIPEFPDYVVRLAELGEATGSLDKALNDAAGRMEYEQTMQSEIRSALTYPAFLATVGGLIVILMFIFVVPRFAALLGDNIAEAPWLSRVVIGFGLWLKERWAFAALAAVGAGAGAVMALRNKTVRASIRTYLESAPMIGAFLRKADVGGWARTVGVALENKARLVDALRLGEAGTRSPRFRRNLELVRRHVRAGQPLDEALFEAQRDIDPVVIDLIRTGRNAGALGEMMIFAAGLFETEARERAKRLTALTEPMAILLIAAIVGTIVVSIVMAMTSLYQFEF